MTATLGADDLVLWSSPNRGLLHEIAGIEPEAKGDHVRLDTHAGVKSIQRLAIADVGGSVYAALWPAELKPQAAYLYREGRARAMFAVARNRSWRITPRPALAFWNSHPSQRLYMSAEISPEDYASRWEGPDAEMIGQHSPEVVTTTIRDWLEDRGYLYAADGEAMKQFIAVLGRRPVHVRPGLMLMRSWKTPGTSSRDLAAGIRRDVNAILIAAGEPTLPGPPD